MMIGLVVEEKSMEYHIICGAVITWNINYKTIGAFMYWWLMKGYMHAYCKEEDWKVHKPTYIDLINKRDMWDLLLGFDEWWIGVYMGL